MDGGLTVEALGQERDVLARFGESVRAAGVAGETRNARVLYLALTSRLLAQPVSVAVKGPSSGGKSFLVERVLDYFPAEAVLKVSGMSDKSLVYLSDDVAHRHIVLAEADGLAGRMQAYFVRTLLSEGQIVWHTVERTKQGIATRTVRKQGPTGLIMTTTRVREDPETETRMLTLTANDSIEQTRRIMQMMPAHERPGVRIDRVWPDFQAWLAAGERRVAVPFVGELAEKCSNAAVRMRRDFTTTVSMLRAHALLHRNTRGRDADGRIIALPADFDVVRRLIGDLLAEGMRLSVPRQMRRTVETVRTLSAEARCGVEMVARLLNIDASSASRRCQAAARAGYIVNERRHSHAPANFRLAIPMPDDVGVLSACSLSPNELQADQNPEISAPIRVNA